MPIEKSETAEKQTELFKDLKIDAKDVTALERELATERAKVSAQQSELEKLKGRLDGMIFSESSYNDKKKDDQRDLAALISAQVGIALRAQKIVPGYDAVGKPMRVVYTDVLSKLDSKFSGEGKSDEYLAARFDLACERAEQASEALSKVNADSADPKAEESAIDKARARALENARTAHERPLSIVRK